MNERLKQFLAAENITQSQFADSINVARASVTHILSGRNKPGYDFISNTMARYPELNIEWLLNGKGKMYNKIAPTQNIEPRDNDLFGGVGASNDYDLKKTESMPFFPSVSEPEENIGTLPHTEVEKIQFSEGIEQAGESEKVPQPIVHQRKAVKIIIFFDDGTFQEF